MPDDLEKVNHVGNTQVTEEQKIQMLIQRAMGDDTLRPTSEQMDALIAQKSKVIDYVREDKKDEQKRFDTLAGLSLHFFYGTLVFVLLIAGGVLAFKPEYFTEVLSALLGFGGGLGIGKLSLFPQAKND